MNSSSKLIAAAVATVLGSSAQALAPSASIAYTFYEAGGSAQENSIYSAVYNLLTPSSVDVYTDSSSGGLSGSYLVVTGTTNPAAANAPFTTATNIMFIYKFNGGSFPNGAFPLAFASGATNSLLPFPVISSLLSTASATGNAQASVTPASPTYKYTPTNTNSQPTDFGVTDVEVPLFNFAYNLNGVAQLTPSQLSGITQEGVYLDVFGFAVTNAVYNGTASFPHPKTSFTKPEILGILAGTTTNWNQLFADDGTQFPNKPMWFLDRGSGSGTKAGENQYFLNYPGGLGYGATITPGSVSATSVNSYSDTILNLSGSYQDVKEASTAACITDLINANNAGDYAVSVLAAQVAPALNLSGGKTAYSFVKIDGVGIDTGSSTDNINGTTSTSYTNVITGAYDYVLQNSFNYRGALLKPSSPGSITTAPAGSAPNVAMAYAVRNNLQSESLAGANTGKAFPLSVTGVLIDPVLAPAQDAGVALDTRAKNSAAPEQPSFDATDVNANSSGNQAITFGSDPL